MYDRKKIRSAQNVTDVSFFVVRTLIDGKVEAFINVVDVVVHLHDPS